MLNQSQLWFNLLRFQLWRKAKYSLPRDKYFGHGDDNLLLFYRYFRQKSLDSPRVSGIGCFCSTEVTLSAPVVCWEFDLGGLENIDLVSCFVNENKRKDDRRCKYVRSIAALPKPNGPVNMQYILNGLAAEFCLDQTNSIYLADLETDLPQDRPIDGDVATYNSSRSGRTDIWLPSRVEVVMSHYLLRLQNKAENIDNIRHLSSQKKCMRQRARR